MGKKSGHWQYFTISNTHCIPTYYVDAISNAWTITIYFFLLKTHISANNMANRDADSDDDDNHDEERGKDENQGWKLFQSPVAFLLLTDQVPLFSSCSCPFIELIIFLANNVFISKSEKHVTFVHYFSYPSDTRAHCLFCCSVLFVPIANSGEDTAGNSVIREYCGQYYFAPAKLPLSSSQRARWQLPFWI